MPARLFEQPSQTILVCWCTKRVGCLQYLSAMLIAQATQTRCLLGHPERWWSSRDPTQTEEGLGAVEASLQHARQVQAVIPLMGEQQANAPWVFLWN